MEMFKGPDNRISLSKVSSCLGYIVFLVMSIVIFFWNPDKFDYKVFAILCAGSSSSLRLYDKWINNKK